MKTIRIILLVTCFLGMCAGVSGAEKLTYYAPVKNEAELKAGTEILIVYRKSATEYWAFTAPEKAHTPESSNATSKGYYCVPTSFQTSTILDGTYIKINRADNLAVLWELTSDNCHSTYLKSVQHGGYLWTRNQYANVSPEAGTDAQQTEDYRLLNFTDPATKSGGVIQLVNPKNKNYTYLRPGTSTTAAWTFMTKTDACKAYIYRKVFSLTYANSSYVTLTNPVFRGDTAIVAAPKGAAMASPTYAGYLDMTRFLGYTTVDGGSQVEYSVGDTIFLGKKGDVTLYPIYGFLQSYKTTFLPDAHSRSVVDSIRGFLPVTMPEAVAEDGYYFKGWQLVGGGTADIYKPGDVYPAGGVLLTNNLTFQAKTEFVFHVLDWRNDTLLIEYPYAATSDSSYVEGGTSALPYANNDLAALQSDQTGGEAGKVDSCIYRLILGIGSQKTSVVNAGQKIRIKFFANGQLINHGTVAIPYFVSDEQAQISQLDFSRNIAAVSDLILCNGASLEIDADDWVFNNVYVYAGSKLVIPEGRSLQVRGNIYLRSGYIAHQEPFASTSSFFFEYPQIDLAGSIDLAGQVYYDMLTSLSMGHMFNLAVPGNVRLQDITYMNGDPIQLAHLSGSDVVDGEMYVEYYDGAKRAQGLASNATAWKDYYTLAPTSLKAGQGYTVMFEPPTRGEGALAKQQRYAMARMPMSVDLTKAETAQMLTVMAHPSLKANDAGWNLVGSPFMANYGGSDSRLQTNGIAILEKKSGAYQWAGNLRYVVIPSNDGKTYSSQLAYAAQLPAFKNFFVQVGTTDSTRLAFTVSESASAPRYAKEQVVEYMTGLTLSSASATDNLGLLIGDAYTAAYEVNADLSKMRTANQLSVYALSSGDELAFMALNPTLAAGAIPVGYVAPLAGQYTFALDAQYDKSAIEALYLTDNLLHRTVDLLSEEYTFTAAKGQDNTRFTLSCTIRPVPQAVENTEVDQVRVVSARGGMSLVDLPQGATLQVYDALGRLLVVRSASAETEYVALPKGVYSARIISANSNRVVRAMVE